MKRIALIAAALPGTAMAHGVHIVEVSGPSGHTLSHLGPVLGLAALVVASLIAVVQRRGTRE